jgi:nucleotide-binding universal stress UspA family protein
MYTRIVVPLDGSEIAELALTRAIELARQHLAPLHLVRVVDVAGGHSYNAFLSLERSGIGTALDSEESLASAYLESIRRQMLDEGIPTTAVTPRGRAVQQIVNLVRPGDAVVMTTHGKGRAPRWFLGRVADEVRRRCPVHVELVPVAPIQVEALDPAAHVSSQELGPR